MSINNNFDKAALDAALEEATQAENMPASYIPIRLSTKGKLGAPEVFHVRNFTTEDLMDLALTDEQDIPVQVVKKLQTIIYEEDCDIKQFTEKEVVETLFIIYKTFYSNMLANMPWELTDEDKEAIAKECGGKTTQAYQERINAYESGDWKPVWDIDLKKVEVNEIPDGQKTSAHVVKKLTNFSYDYEIPRYGDVLILKKFIDTVYKEKDKKWAKIKEQVTLKEKLNREFESGRSNNSGLRVFIPENELKEFKEYEKEKTLFALSCMKALHLIKVNGEDISNKTLPEKLEILNSSTEFDHASYKKATEALESLKYGLKETIPGVDPILHKRVEVPYTFRVFTLLQAIRDNESDQTTVTLE